MSIINDALKKTQLKFTKTDKKPPEKVEEKPAEQSVSNVYEKLYKKPQDGQKVTSVRGKESAEKSSSRKATVLRSAKKWLSTSVTFLISAAILYGAFLLLSQLQPVQKFIKTIKRESAGSASSIARRMPKRNYKPGELVLNGTSLIDGKRVALINDEIYQVGETVDGKRITSIDLNQIELQDDEKTITLKVH